MNVSRRAVLLGSAACLAHRAARALGRIPTGGALDLAIPWPIRVVDPHRIDDVASALFAGLVAEPLFALDGASRPYPTLASALPSQSEGMVRLTLRPNLATAKGRALDARDVIFAIERARSSGAVGVLANVPRPAPVAGDPLSVTFVGGDALALATALASPTTALVPRGFAPAAPDGTGPFMAVLRAGRLELVRNTSAARGAAFLERVTVKPARDLAEALRLFEVGDSDLGWLGAGLHRARPGAVAFDGGSPGWVVLRTGREVGPWGAPGVAQQLADSVPASRLAHLGLSGLPAAPGVRWAGPPSDLLVDEGAPQLVEVARVVAGALSAPEHELRLAPRGSREVAERLARGQFAVALDFGRRVGPAPRDLLLSLAALADRGAAKRPPTLGSYEPRVVTRTLPLGILGELRLTGAHIPALQLREWNLADAWRARA